MVTLTAAKNQVLTANQIPYSKELQIGSVVLQAYYHPGEDYYFFSPTQVAKQFEDYKRGGVDFLKSKRAESILTEASSTQLGVALPKITARDSRGVEQVVVNPFSVAQTVAYIIDILRKKGLPKAQMVLTLLGMDSLQRRCDSAFGKLRAEEEYSSKEASLFKVLNKRGDTEIQVEEDDEKTNLLTSSELAKALKLPLNGSNKSKFAADLLRRFPNTGKLLGRRLYNLDDPEIRQAACEIYNGYVLKNLEFEKTLDSSAFGDRAMNSFSDL